MQVLLMRVPTHFSAPVWGRTGFAAGARKVSANDGSLFPCRCPFFSFSEKTFSSREGLLIGRMLPRRRRLIGAFPEESAGDVIAVIAAPGFQRSRCQRHHSEQQLLLCCRRKLRVRDQKIRRNGWVRWCGIGGRAGRYIAMRN